MFLQRIFSSILGLPQPCSHLVTSDETKVRTGRQSGQKDSIKNNKNLRDSVFSQLYLYF